MLNACKCGSEDIGVTKNWNTGQVFVECQTCDHRGPAFKASKGSAAKARAAWNGVK